MKPARSRKFEATIARSPDGRQTFDEYREVVHLDRLEARDQIHRLEDRIRRGDAIGLEQL